MPKAFQTINHLYGYWLTVINYSWFFRAHSWLLLDNFGNVLATFGAFLDRFGTVSAQFGNTKNTKNLIYATENNDFL